MITSGSDLIDQSLECLSLTYNVTCIVFIQYFSVAAKILNCFFPLNAVGSKQETHCVVSYAIL